MTEEPSLKILITMEDKNMAISGIGQNYDQNYITENKNVNSTEKFALE